MKSNGREDSGRYGIILGSDVVLRIEPSALAGAPASEDATPGRSDAKTIVDESVVLSTVRSSERALLALVDGQRTVQELVRLSGMSDLLVRRHLRALCERGVLIPTNLPVTEAPPESVEAAAPRRSVTPDRGAATVSDGLSKALTDYLDSGKTAAVAAPLPDAITAKGEAAADSSRSSDSGPTRNAAVGAIPQSNPEATVVVSNVPTESPLDGDTEPSPQRRLKSPASGVITGEWPPHRSSGPTFKPNVTAFWVPSSSESTSPEPSSAPLGSSPFAGGTATGADAPVRPIRPLSPAQGTVVVSGSAGAPSASAPGLGKVSEAVPTAVPMAGSRGGRSGPVPFRLGEYEVATRIAQGGMGSIYVCRRAGVGQPSRLFTLKVVRQHSKQVAQVIQSFRREARVGTLLNHPNLQTVVHVGTYHEQPFLILDYVEGIGLADLMAGQKRLPPAIVVSVLLDILRGLQAAHDLVDEQGARLGLVHGDISPQNILVGVDGNARLTDFGSARFSSDARSADSAPVLMGKPAFMSPEQLCADPIDARTDLFSLGVVMWTALTGQSLFVADSYDQIVVNIFRKKIPPPSEFGAPACFDEIAAGALSRAPDGRYGSAEEMANALARAARSEGIVGSPFDVGQWVRREFSETLAERRRRIQVVFGGGTSGTTPEPVPVIAAAASAKAPGAEEPRPAEKGTASADGFARLPSRTIEIPATRRSTPRLTALTAIAEPIARTRWRVVFLSALITFPFALAITYVVSNPMVKRIRAARAAPARVDDEAKGAPRPETNGAPRVAPGTERNASRP